MTKVFIYNRATGMMLIKAMSPRGGKLFDVEVIRFVLG
jgi:hypothetical protein